MPRSRAILGRRSVSAALRPGWCDRRAQPSDAPIRRSQPGASPPLGRQPPGTGRPRARTPGPRRRGLRDRRNPGAPRGRRHRRACRWRPHQRPAAPGRPVKTFHPAVYAGILARRDRPEQLAELAEHAIGLIDLVVVNVEPFAPQVGERRVPLDEAIEMIDVGGTALLSAAARNYAGVAAVPEPGRVRAGRRRDPGPGQRLRRAPPAPGRRGIRRRGRLRRPGRGLPEPGHGHDVPAPHQRRPREGGDLPTARTRTSGRPSTARRPTATARWPTRRGCRAASPRSTTCSTSTPRGGSPPISPPRPPWSCATRTPSGSPRTTPLRTRSGTPSRRTRRRLRQHRRRQPDRGRGDRARDRGGDVRGARGAGYTDEAAADPLRAAGARAPRGPAEPVGRPARLRDRGPRLQAGRRRAPRRDARRDGPRPGPAAGGDPAAPDPRGADRPHVRLAGRRPRPLQRDRPGPQPPDRGDRRRPGEPPGGRGDRPAASRRPGQDGGDVVGRLLPLPRRDRPRGDLAA